MSSLSFEQSMMALGGRMQNVFPQVPYGRGMGDARSESYGRAREEWRRAVPIADGYVVEIQRSIKALRDRRDAYQNAAIAMERDLGPVGGYQIQQVAGQIVGLSSQISDMIDQIEPAFNRFNSAYQGWRSMSGDSSWLTAEQAKAAEGPYPGNGGDWVVSKFAAIASLAANTNTVLRDLEANYQALQSQAQQVNEAKQKQARELQQIADDQARAAKQAAEDAQVQADARNAAALAAQQAAAAQADAQARVELARIQAQQAASAGEAERAQADRNIQLQIEQQRLAQEAALQETLFALKQQEAQRAYEREERSSERQEERDQLALILQLMDKGLIQPGQVELEGIGPLGAPQAQGANYQGAANYQGGPVPLGYQLIDEMTGQPVQQGYPGGQVYPGYPAPMQSYGYPGTPTYGPPPVVAPAPQQQQQAPQQQGGIPGIEFGPLDVGRELFGMGGMGDGEAVSLPAGAKVAPGYLMSPTGTGNWTVTAPDGRQFYTSNAQVTQPGSVQLLDPPAGVIFYSKPDEPSMWDSIAKGLNTITPFGVKAADSYLRAERGESLLSPQQPQGGGGISGTTLAIGGAVLLGIAGAVVFATRKKGD